MLLRNSESQKSGLHIRGAIIDDLEAISNIDAQISATRKADYWQEMFENYSAHREQAFFYVAVHADRVIGFIVGEIRAWEFGSAPCGWVFAIGVKTDERVHKVGTSLLERLCERFRQAGVRKVRTMVNRADREIMAFFRSQGLMAGPYQELEKDLD